MSTACSAFLENGGGFYYWKLWVEKDALLTIINPGSILSINVDGFVRRHLRHRSPFRSIPLEPETLQIATCHPRQRDTSLDSLLAQNTDLSFKFTRVIRSGPNHWSQAFFGRVPQSDRVVCLKVFDERFFLVPEPDYKDSLWYPYERLRTFNAAVELVQREEGVYDRVRYLQGSLIMGSMRYVSLSGFRNRAQQLIMSYIQITMPDGWKCFGMLMEVIDGPSLGKIGAKNLPSDAQSILVGEFPYSSHSSTDDVQSGSVRSRD